MEKKLTLLNALQPIYFYSKFLGLAPIYCNKKGINTCFFGFFVNIALIILSIVWLVWRFIHFYNLKANNDIILTHCTEISNFLLVIASVFSLMLFLLRTKKNINGIIEKIQTADELIYGDQTDLLYRQNRNVLLVETFFILTLHFIFIFYKSWLYYGEHPFMYFKYLIYFINSIVNLQLINWLFLLRQRYHKIDENLNNKNWHTNAFQRKFLLFSKRIEVIPAEFSNDIIHPNVYVKKLRYAHLNLCETVGWLEKHYGLIILVQMINKLFILLLHGYLALRIFINETSDSNYNSTDLNMGHHLIRKSESFNVFFLSTNFLLTSYVIMEIFCLTFSSNSLNNVRRQLVLTIKRLVINLESDSETTVLREELTNLANQVTVSSVSISAAGFFKIDLTLFTSILSTVITYLIVMITNTNFSQY